MTDRMFAIHTTESASSDGRAALERVRAAVGLVPNLAATMAESPELLNGFLTLRELYLKTGFSPAEIQVLSLVAAYENRCAWCMAFHTAMALKEGLSRASVDHLRSGEAPNETRAAALSEFARTLIRKRGHVGSKTLETFLQAGFEKRQALDVVLGMAFSLLANYAGHLTDPPLDAFLEPHAWTARETAASAV